MADARLVEVAEAVRAEIAAGPFDDPAGMEPASVERVWGMDFEADRAAGLRVHVVPVGYSQPETATRAEVTWEYTVGVVVTDRYSEAGQPPKEWVDERVRWVLKNVWERVGDARHFDAVAGAWPESGEVSAFDPEFLRELKLFWSEVTVAIREVG